MAESGLTAKHLTEMLRLHYQPPSRPTAGALATEITSPCGARRADAIWFPTTVAGGKGELIGHEIKVSRSDVLIELADPTKADPWSKFCTRWWLVVAHPSLVSNLEIPEAWGVLAPPSGRRTRTMTIVRPAPKLKPVNPAPGIARMASWLLYNDQEETARLRQKVTDLERRVRMQDQTIASLRVNGASSRRDPKAEKLMSILTAVEAHGVDDPFWWREVDERVVIAAIIDATTAIELAQTARDQVRSMTREVERLVNDPLKYVQRQLAAADKLVDSRDVLAATVLAKVTRPAATVVPDDAPDQEEPPAPDPTVDAALAVVQDAFPEAAHV